MSCSFTEIRNKTGKLCSNTNHNEKQQLYTLFYGKKTFHRLYININHRRYNRVTTMYDIKFLIEVWCYLKYVSVNSFIN